MEDYNWDIANDNHSSRDIEYISNLMQDEVSMHREYQCVPEVNEETYDIPAPSAYDNTLCGGIFINDKSYNEHKAHDYFHQEEIERKAVSDAIKRGDFSAAKCHEAAANSNHKLAVDYQNMANKSAK